MKARWRPAGVSFTLRLLLLLLIPLLGVGVLSFQRIESERTAFDGASMLVEGARRQQSVAAVYGPAQLEQIALEGLASIDALGVPRDVVVSTAGVDFESTYNANATVFEQRLDELASDHGPWELGDGSTLGQRLSFIRGELAVQRRLSSEGRATQTDVRSVFAGLDELLAQTLAVNDADASVGGAGTTDRQSQLTELAAVLSAAGERGKALLNGLLERTPETTAEIVRSAIRLDYAVERFDDSFDTADPRFDAIAAELEPVPEIVLTRTAEASDSIAIDFDPEYIRASAGAVLDQVGFLESLERYSSEFHQEAVNELEADAIDANRAATNTRLFAGAVAVISLTILLFLALSTLRPLRRLTRRARDISDGSLDVDPLPEHGPRDVRILTGTMNAMAVTLRGVDHEIADLASGAPGEHDRHLPGTIGISITQSFERLEAMTRRLHASEQLASSIVEQAADAIWTIDEHGFITMANGASVELTGVDADDQVGKALNSFLPRTSGEISIERASGETARLLVASSEITGGERPLTTVMARDISERLRFEERLAYQANHDALTGLPNRFAVLEAIRLAPPDQPLAVLFVDLDGFKSVNDTQGHLAGDRVLSEVGRRLSEHIRRGDFVGRLGGDEFVVVMNGVAHDADAASFGHRLIRAIEQPYRDADHLFVLSASVGVCTFAEGLAEENSTPLEAIRRADSAVYAAKQRGRGRVEAFDELMQARIVHDAEIEMALRSAVRNDELELHLQPVFDTVLDRFTAAEALVRWNRPGEGLVPPGDFIPIAEKSSLIDEISRWVLTTACTTLARWAHDDVMAERRIAVNIAGSHLLDGNLLADLDAAVLLSGADPRLLEFELTETQLMDDHARAASILEEIRARGIRVAIDDFGTGYSSMAYLRQLPIDTLKIDRSFIAPIGDGDADEDTTVTDALLTIGQALGLSVVAEGIETRAQLDYVVGHGADRAQGFFLARPMPISAAEQFVRDHEAHAPPRDGTPAPRAGQP